MKVEIKDLELWKFLIIRQYLKLFPALGSDHKLERVQKK